jgi:hypothetical protein
MHGTLLHKVDDLILDNNCVIHIVVQLHLQFVLQLAGLVQKLFIFNWISKVFVILSEQVHFADVRPGVEAIAHGVLCPDAYVFATSEEVQFVNLPLKVFPIQNVG